MLHLEHLNLVVKDLEETLTFYRAAFPHWYVREQGEADWYGTQRNWLHFGDDIQYLTFNDKGTGENRNLKSNQLGLSHFAYVVDDIKSITTRLVEAGFSVHLEGTPNQFRENVYFLDPNGYEVEFVEYLSDIPAQRNNSDPY